MEADADSVVTLRDFEALPATRLNWQVRVEPTGLSKHRRPGRTSSPTVAAWYRPHLERLHDDAQVRHACGPEPSVDSGDVRSPGVPAAQVGVVARVRGRWS